MQLAPGAPEVVAYHCNLCGRPNRLPAADFHREVALCAGCGANARFRGIVRVLARALAIDPALPLAAWPAMRRVRGLGMSDWEGYARLLAQRCAYTNTYYDREPRLDIQAPRPDQLGTCDFVISTDVFEHILPPLQRAFDNLRALLKPGGTLIFSVPYTRAAHTVEHFAGLGDLAILDYRGTRILVGRDATGALAVRDHLVFHGGEGATLEMRLYCEADILDRLRQAGFADIVVHDTPDLACGYYWPPLLHGDPAHPRMHAYIITARRP